EGQHASAVPYFEQALEREPEADTRRELHYLVSVARFRAGDLRGAVERAERGLEEFPDATTLLANRAVARVFLGVPGAEDEARHAFQVASGREEWLASAVASDAMVRVAMFGADLAAAEDWIERARLGYRKSGNRFGVLRTMGSRVLVLRAQGKLAEAAD